MEQASLLIQKQQQQLSHSLPTTNNVGEIRKIAISKFLFMRFEGRDDYVSTLAYVFFICYFDAINFQFTMDGQKKRNNKGAVHQHTHTHTHTP